MSDEIKEQEIPVSTFAQDKAQKEALAGAYARGWNEGEHKGYLKAKEDWYYIKGTDDWQGLDAPQEPPEKTFRRGFSRGYQEALPAHCACFSCRTKASRLEEEAVQDFSAGQRNAQAASEARDSRQLPDEDDWHKENTFYWRKENTFYCSSCAARFTDSVKEAHRGPHELFPQPEVYSTTLYLPEKTESSLTKEALAQKGEGWNGRPILPQVPRTT